MASRAPARVVVRTAATGGGIDDLELDDFLTGPDDRAAEGPSG
ncbi:hypothetical protein ATKI12_8771 [Kitasatospora sp. Ki12]